MVRNSRGCKHCLRPTTKMLDEFNAVLRHSISRHIWSDQQKAKDTRALIGQGRAWHNAARPLGSCRARLGAVHTQRARVTCKAAGPSTSSAARSGHGHGESVPGRLFCVGDVPAMQIFTSTLFTAIYVFLMYII